MYRIFQQAFRISFRLDQVVSSETTDAKFYFVINLFRIKPLSIFSPNFFKNPKLLVGQRETIETLFSLDLHNESDLHMHGAATFPVADAYLRWFTSANWSVSEN